MEQAVSSLPDRVELSTRSFAESVTERFAWMR
jgi:hypothetical protein